MIIKGAVNSLDDARKLVDNVNFKLDRELRWMYGFVTGLFMMYTIGAPDYGVIDWPRAVVACVALAGIYFYRQQHRKSLRDAIAQEFNRFKETLSPVDRAAIEPNLWKEERRVGQSPQIPQ